MKQHEVIYPQHNGIKLERDGSDAIISIGNEKVTLSLTEFGSFLDAIEHLERRTLSYAEGQLVRKVVNE